jgi:hypothetical protein
MPSYPTLARLSRTSIEVSAAITLATDGKIQSVAFERVSDTRPAAQHLLLPTIEQTIRASAFQPECGNKTVPISYAFKMDAAPDVTASWFGYPNRVEMWAVSPPAGY